MKVLLLKPSQENIISYNTGWSLGVKDAGYYPPLGLLYVASYLKENNSDVEVRVIDAASPDMPYPELEEKIKDFNPDIIGISTYTQTFIDTLKAASIAKKINPKIHICLGGHHVQYFPVETLQHKIFDSIIIGEGEIKFAELVDRLMKGKSIEDINGVFSRNNVKYADKYNKAESFISDISKLPFPDKDMIKEYDYYNLLTINKKMTTLVSSRGCPYSCKFCTEGRQPYRQRSSKDIVDEIEQCIRQGYTDFFFADDTFNINKKKVIDFCNELKARNLKISWCCKARINKVDLETLQIMAETGCYLINLGVETGTDEGLKLLRKGTTTEEIRNVFKWCKEVNIKTFAYFMIGLPFEKTKEGIMKNIDFLVSLKPDFCNINIFTPLPSTPYFNEGVEKGLVSYEPWKQMVLAGKEFVPDLWEEFFSREELQKLRMHGFVKFYMRPSYILKQFVNMASFSQFLYAARVAKNIFINFLAMRWK